jgi:ammonia channel protein AmtB
MMSGALAGIFSAAPGLDMYYPPLAFLMGIIGGLVVPMVDKFIAKVFKLDEAVGAFAVHGVGGLIGLLGAGIFLAGYPNVNGYPEISFMGQLTSAAVMAALGFIPGFGLSWLMAKAGFLRVPPKAEIAGLDLVEVPLTAYPEAVPATSNVSKETATA